MNLMVEVLAKLVLQNSRDVSTLLGAVFVTYMKKSTGCMIEEVMKEAGERYNEKAKEMKARKEKADAEVNMEDLGPPFLHAAGLLAKRMAEKEATFKDHLGNEQLGSQRVAFWNAKMVKTTAVQELGGMVKVFRITTFKIGKKAGWVKFQMMIPDADFEHLLHAAFRLLNWERMVGPAPRSALEREAQRLLDKMRG